MAKKITFGISTIMVAAMVATIAPQSASAGGFSKLKSHKISGQIVNMNGKMAPKPVINKTTIIHRKSLRKIHHTYKYKVSPTR